MSTTALIVDDDAALRRALAQRLAHWGYEVREAASGTEAVGACRRAEHDVVLLDLSMPGMSGMDVLKAFREEGVGSDVVVLTAHGSVENAVEAMKLGAFEFLSKPIEMDRLAISVGHGIELGRLSRTVSDLRERLSSRRAFDQVVGTEGALRETLLLGPGREAGVRSSPPVQLHPCRGPRTAS